MPSPTRIGLAALGVALVAAVGCAQARAMDRPTSIAMPWNGELLFVARGSELWRYALSKYHGIIHSKPTEVPGPCERYLDLEIWNEDLFALCDDGQVFFSCVTQPGYTTCDSDAWVPIPELTGPAIAFQRSDNRLLVVGLDASLREVATHNRDREPGIAAPEFDRFRGGDRGGPGQLPVATFDDYWPTAAHGISLRRGLYLSAGGNGQGFACTVARRRGRVGDIAVDTHGTTLAATFIGRSGREMIALMHSRYSWRTFAGVFDPASGRRLAVPIACGWRDGR